MSFLKRTANMNHFMELLMSNPKRYSHIIAFLDEVSLNLTELSWKDCEVIAKHISEENNSPFCSGLHLSIATQLNAPKYHSEKLASILKFASKLNNESRSINEKDVQTLIEAGCSEQTIEDLVALVASINVFNILANGLGFKAIAREIFSQMGQMTIAHKGNLATYNSFLQNV